MYAVVNHIGNGSGGNFYIYRYMIIRLNFYKINILGHYTTYIQIKGEEGYSGNKWVQFDDENVTFIEEK